jgi:hypothetical protein
MVGLEVKFLHVRLSILHILMLTYYFQSYQRRPPIRTAISMGDACRVLLLGLPIAYSRLRTTIISSIGAPNHSDLSATTHLNPSELTMPIIPHSSTQSPIAQPTHMLWWNPAERRAEDSYYSFFLRWASSRSTEVGWHIMDSASNVAALPVTCVPICA